MPWKEELDKFPHLLSYLYYFVVSVEASEQHMYAYYIFVLMDAIVEEIGES